MLAGPADGAYVYDLTTKQVLFSERATTARPPASVEKLYTATAALQDMGAERAAVHERARCRPACARRASGKAASTCAAAATRPSAAAHSSPPLRRRRGERLGTREQLVKVDGIHRVTGSIEGDESYFDSLRGEPSSSYAPDPYLEGTLSALAFNRGESGANGGPTPPPPTRPGSCGRRCGPPA